MKQEINAAVSFLIRLIVKSDSVSPEQTDKLNRVMCQMLEQKFANHWHPENPLKGQAYRCIRVNSNDRRDSILAKTCEECGIKYEVLSLPIELTVWVDPEEVSCRFGENTGSHCVVANFREGNSENYIDDINIDELEQRSLERDRQSSFDLINCQRKKRQLQNNKQKNGYSHGSNGFYDHSSPTPNHANQHHMSNTSNTSSPPLANNSYYPSSLPNSLSSSPFSSEGSLEGSPPNHLLFSNNRINMNQQAQHSPPHHQYNGQGSSLRNDKSHNGLNGFSGHNGTTMAGKGGYSARNLNSAFSNLGLGAFYPPTK